ncbi:GrpB family protein [Oscillospiraceae bacterium OttesenSCG-928-G22]|nr:GrpB family protein [Oscillospiraceae bacterium OttesenSCG-928-G22]
MPLDNGVDVALYDILTISLGGEFQAAAKEGITLHGVQRNKVQLLPHDENWNTEFLKTKDMIQTIWPENVLDIQHIGSTAIRGIYAKPILDIAVVLTSLQAMDIDAMRDVGYDYRGPQNKEDTHRLFVLRGEHDVSLHHLHCYGPGDRNFALCVAFRDYLNSHPRDAARYSELKIALANRYPDDRVAYTNAKEEFIQSICMKATQPGRE